VGAGLFLAKEQTDRQIERKADGKTDQTKIMTLILVFYNFTNTSKNNSFAENIV